MSSCLGWGFSLCFVMLYGLVLFSIPSVNLFFHSFIGRSKNVQSSIRLIRNQSKRFSRYDDRTVTISGRIIFDMMLLMMRHNTKPRYCGSSYAEGEFTLGEVGRRYLTETKADVKYTDIYILQENGPESRKILAVYCLQDTKLPYALMIKHIPEPRKEPNSNVLKYYIEAARSSGLPLKYLVTKSTDYHSYFKRVRKVKSLVHVLCVIRRILWVA